MFSSSYLLTIVPKLDPLTTLLLCCTCKLFCATIYKTINAELFRLYISNYMSIIEIKAVNLTEKYMDGLLLNKMMTRSECVCNNEAELLILNGNINVFFRSQWPKKLLLLNTIIQSKYYIALVRQIIDGQLHESCIKYIPYCKIGLLIKKNLKLFQDVEKMFPLETPRRFNLQDCNKNLLLKTTGGHSDNRQLEIYFQQHNVTYDIGMFCARSGLNNIVRHYISFFQHEEEYLRIFQFAGTGANMKLLRSARRSGYYYNLALLQAFVQGLIYGDHLDMVIKLHDDRHYTFDYNTIEIVLEECINREISLKTIIFCMTNVKFIMPLPRTQLFRWNISDDIIVFITEFIDDFKTNPEYLTHVDANSVNLMLELGYALPYKSSSNSAKIIYTFCTSPQFLGKYNNDEVFTYVNQFINYTDSIQINPEYTQIAAMLSSGYILSAMLMTNKSLIL